nr:MAG TPA: hypothetical protein [Caudoviricetes sp.]
MNYFFKIFTTAVIPTVATTKIAKFSIMFSYKYF